MQQEKFADYVYISKVCLSTVGLWPMPDGTLHGRLFLQKVHIFITYTLLWVFLLIPGAVDLYMVWGNVDSICENFCVAIYLWSAVAKFTQMMLNRGIFKDLLDIMKKDWDYTLQNYESDEKKVLLQYAGITRTLSKSFVLLTYFIAIQLFCTPLVFDLSNHPIRNRWYPARCWYFNIDKTSDVIYGCLYMNQLFVGVVIGISLNLGLDTFCCIAVALTCAQINIFERELLELGKETKLSSFTLRKLIQKHNHFIRVVKLINEIFSNVTLYQLLVSCIAICVSGFQLIMTLYKTEVDIHGISLNTAFIIIALFQILLYCFPGDQLEEQSLRVGSAAYSSLWINLPNSTRQEVKLLILRSQTPMNIVAGKTFVLSLPRFLSIVKTSMSCLSVLRASYENKNKYEK